MKIVITAGGGGHFSPALAVIKKLPKDVDVLFIGRKYAFENDKTISFEYQTVRELQIPFKTITTGRLQRKLTFHSLTSLTKLPYGFWQSLRILKAYHPDVVFSTGGYISLPVTLAATLLGIPVVLHEQTMRAGLANKIAGKFARKICLSWEQSRSFFPKDRVIITGNPLREEFLHPRETEPEFKEQLPLIYITGGSLGSHGINILVEQILEQLLTKYTVFHQTGDAQEYRDYERLVAMQKKLPEKLRVRYHPVKFVPPDEVAGVLKQAALVISRSGMSTITELLFFKKPSLLIPLPHGQRNEQWENAQFLASLGLARVKKQEDLTHETMYTEIEEMMAELDSYTVTGTMPPVIQKDATEKIIATILSIAKELPQKAEKETNHS